MGRGWKSFAWSYVLEDYDNGGCVEQCADNGFAGGVKD